MLKGRGGADTLISGTCDDRLIGGRDLDSFVITGIDPGQVNRGGIVDLEAGEIVDLHLIDANVEAAATGDQAFTRVQRFTDTAGELVVRYDAGEDHTRVRGDVDGDGQADFILTLNGDQTGFAGLIL